MTIDIKSALAAVDQVAEAQSKATLGPWFAYFSEQAMATIQEPRGWLFQHCMKAVTCEEGEAQMRDAKVAVLGRNFPAADVSASVRALVEELYERNEDLIKLTAEYAKLEAERDAALAEVGRLNKEL